MAVVVNGVQAYPLKWPAGVPRSKWRTSSKFKVSDAEIASDALLNEVALMGGKLPVISSNLKPRNSAAANVDPRTDPGVAIYFQRKGKSMVFACDRWSSVKDNIHALKLTIGALRGIERWGSAEMMEQAYSGFAALPATTAGESWWSILDIQPDATLDYVDAAYRRLAKVAHSDIPGGDTERMQKLNWARDQARAVRR